MYIVYLTRCNSRHNKISIHILCSMLYIQGYIHTYVSQSSVSGETTLSKKLRIM